jgi:Na+/H+ antiporter NhaD/arsenite permease-like protein
MRLWFAGLIVIAANAGGAWSPLGDVTTTMLWIANKVTPYQLVIHVLLPSSACFAIPVLVASRNSIFKGYIENELIEEHGQLDEIKVEMARDLKISKSQRNKIHEKTT